MQHCRSVRTRCGTVYHCSGLVVANAEFESVAIHCQELAPKGGQGAVFHKELLKLR
jgi:hypothetical protein